MWAYTLVAPRRFEKQEVPTLTAENLSPGQVLLRPVVGGICGSDLPAFVGHRPPPLGPGCSMHEIVGEVVASRAPRIPEGARVVGWASGMSALAERTLAGGAELTTLDPGWDPAAAITIQPLACVLYAVDQLGRLDSARVAVMGLGSIGLLFCHVLKQFGAGHVTGIDLVDRAGEATAFGIDEVVHSASRQWAAALDDEKRPAAVVEAVGHQTGTLLDAVSAVAREGQIYYFGIPESIPYTLDMGSFLRKNLTLKSGGTLRREEYLDKACQYFQQFPELAPSFVTHLYGIDEVTAAYQTASIPAPGRIKVAIRFQPAGDADDQGLR